MFNNSIPVGSASPKAWWRFIIFKTSTPAERERLFQAWVVWARVISDCASNSGSPSIQSLFQNVQQKLPGEISFIDTSQFVKGSADVTIKSLRIWEIMRIFPWFLYITYLYLFFCVLWLLDPGLPRQAPRKALPQAGYAPKTVADLEKLIPGWQLLGMGGVDPMVFLKLSSDQNPRLVGLK